MRLLRRRRGGKWGHRRRRRRRSSMRRSGAAAADVSAADRRTAPQQRRRRCRCISSSSFPASDEVDQCTLQGQLSTRISATPDSRPRGKSDSFVGLPKHRHVSALNSASASRTTASAASSTSFSGCAHWHKGERVGVRTWETVN
jgi:hypothetical protein